MKKGERELTKPAGIQEFARECISPADDPLATISQARSCTPRFAIRPACEADVSSLLKFMWDFVVFLKDERWYATNAQRMRDYIIRTTGKDPSCSPHNGRCLMIDSGNRAVGYLLMYHQLIPHSGRWNLYLEDLFLSDAARGKSLGRRVFQYLAARVVYEDLPLLEWWCPKTNVSGLKFYAKMGATAIKSIVEFWLYREAVSKLGSISSELEEAAKGDISPILFRQATNADSMNLAESIRKSACEKGTEQITITAEILSRQVLGPSVNRPADRKAFAMLLVPADNPSVILGHAIYLTSFDVNTGLKGIYLKDFFVDPAHRRQGLGRRFLARIAKLSGGCRIEWTFSKDNLAAMMFSRSLNAEQLDYRVHFILTAGGCKKLLSNTH